MRRLCKDCEVRVRVEPLSAFAGRFRQVVQLPWLDVLVFPRILLLFGLLNFLLLLLLLLLFLLLFLLLLLLLLLLLNLLGAERLCFCYLLRTALIRAFFSYSSDVG